MYTILIVDDDDPLRATIAELLELEGYNIIQAANGKAGLLSIRNHKLDLVITDYLMPKMTGIELVKAIRSDEKLSTLPIVLLSGDAKSLKPADAQRLDVNFVVIKPFEIVEFISMVTQLLQAKKQ